VEIVQWLDIVNFGLVVLIWLVQLIIYPSFAHVDATGFIDWHRKYMARVSSLVIPLMLGQMFLVLKLVYLTSVLTYFLMLSGIAIIWISSFSLSVPCHNKLQENGKDQAIIKRLIQTNWIRTILWTAVFLTGLIK
jgi:hypothetical protein